MSTIDQRQPEHGGLGNFEQRLLTELRAHVAARPALTSAPTPVPVAVGAAVTRRLPKPGLRRPRRWRPRLGMLTAAAAAAAAAVVTLLSALPAAQPALARAFPILNQTPQRLPIYMQQLLRTEPLTAGSYEPTRDRAFAFTTPAGTGYVVLDARTRWLCVLIPGIDASGARVRCEDSSVLLSSRSRGLRVSVTGDDHRHELVWLLPQGSTAAVATAAAGGAAARSQAAEHDGVLALVTRHPVTIHTTIHGHRTTLTFGD